MHISSHYDSKNINNNKDDNGKMRYKFNTSGGGGE